MKLKEARTYLHKSATSKVIIYKSCGELFLACVNPQKNSISTLPRLERIYNPITAMGFSAMFTFSWTTLRGKHCWHPIAIMGVVDLGKYGQIKN